MSGHETIRVLEVGVDAPLTTENEGKKTTAGEDGKEAPANCPPTSSEQRKEGIEQNPEKACGELSGKKHFVFSISPDLSIHSFSSGEPFQKKWVTQNICDVPL